MLAFLGCSPKVQPTVTRPDWLSAKPFPQGYYTGIGHSDKISNTNYIQVAKKSALEDLVSEIKVNITSSSVLSQLDVNKVFSERYEQIIQTEAADEIEEFELVDAWEDATNYWVYYRLSKQRYAEIKAEQKRNAVALATDYFEKGKQSESDGDRIRAIGFYFQALRSIEKYLGEAIRIEHAGREILLTNEIFASLQLLLDRIELNCAPRELALNRRLIVNEQSLNVTAVYKDLGTTAPGLPLRASFVKGQGVVHPSYTTNEEGHARLLITKIESREFEQAVEVAVDADALAGATDSPIFSFVVDLLKVPSSQVVLTVQRPVVYITADERSFGSRMQYEVFTSKLKNLLAKAGFEFSDERGTADLWMDVATDTSQGSISGSIYITYLNGSVRVRTSNGGTEIYAMNLDRIKGYGLDYSRSSVDAYAKAMESLEKERINELVNTVLQ